MVRKDNKDSLRLWVEREPVGRGGRFTSDIKRVEDVFGESEWIDLWIDACGFKRLNGKVTAGDLRSIGHDPSKVFNPSFIRFESSDDYDRFDYDQRIPDKIEFYPSYQTCSRDGCDKELMFSDYVDCIYSNEEGIPEELFCSECSDRRREKAREVDEIQYQSFSDYEYNNFKTTAGEFGQNTIDNTENARNYYTDILGVFLVSDYHAGRVSAKEGYEEDVEEAKKQRWAWDDVYGQVRQFIEDVVYGEDCVKCGRKAIHSPEPPAVRLKQNHCKLILETDVVCSKCYKLHVLTEGM